MGGAQRAGEDGRPAAAVGRKGAAAARVRRRLGGEVVAAKKWRGGNEKWPSAREGHFYL
jgi:hypothetical protein